ncbi:MAG: hypothetical protein KM310_07925 [Clostridiales bacterium]|nr:hypothetical protein [Clostridiales bacterium]
MTRRFSTRRTPPSPAPGRASGARDPSDIVVPALIASAIALLVTVFALLLWRLFWRPT